MTTCFETCILIQIQDMFFRRTQMINKAAHEPNGSIKTTAYNTPDDGSMKARNM